MSRSRSDEGGAVEKAVSQSGNAEGSGEVIPSPKTES